MRNCYSHQRRVPAHLVENRRQAIELHPPAHHQKQHLCRPIGRRADHSNERQTNRKPSEGGYIGIMDGKLPGTCKARKWPWPAVSKAKTVVCNRSVPPITKTCGSAARAVSSTPVDLCGVGSQRANHSQRAEPLHLRCSCVVAVSPTLSDQSSRCSRHERQDECVPLPSTDTHRNLTFNLGSVGFSNAERNGPSIPRQA